MTNCLRDLFEGAHPPNRTNIISDKNYDFCRYVYLKESGNGHTGKKNTIAGAKAGFKLNGY